MFCKNTHRQTDEKLNAIKPYLQSYINVYTYIYIGDILILVPSESS